MNFAYKRAAAASDVCGYGSLLLVISKTALR